MKAGHIAAGVFVVILLVVLTEGALAAARLRWPASPLADPVARIRNLLAPPGGA